jgi:hypothetical protein
MKSGEVLASVVVFLACSDLGLGAWLDSESVLVSEGVFDAVAGAGGVLVVVAADVSVEAVGLGRILPEISASLTTHSTTSP